MVKWSCRARTAIRTREHRLVALPSFNRCRYTVIAMEVLSLQDARKITTPIIYGLVGPADGRIVYVGKTKNPHNRLNQYASPSTCHNAMLAEWLTSNRGQWRVAILERDPLDLNAAERRQIRIRRHQTFNLISGGDEMWRNHITQPWMAGTGIKCPSDYLLTRLKKNGGDLSLCQSVRDMRKNMTMLDRCKYEVALAMDIESQFPGMMPQVNSWLDRTRDKMLSVMEAEA